MTSPNVQVEPGELEAAGSTIGGYGASVRSLGSGSFGSLAAAMPGVSSPHSVAAGMAGFETAGAIGQSGAAVHQALSTIAGRCDQFAEALKVGAHSILWSDAAAARRLRSIGDLNQLPGA